MLKRTGGGTYDPLSGDTAALFPASAGGSLPPSNLGPGTGMGMGPVSPIPAGSPTGGPVGVRPIAGPAMPLGPAPAPMPGADIGRQMLLEELARKIGKPSLPGGGY